MESIIYKKFGGKTLGLALKCSVIQLIFLSVSPDAYAVNSITKLSVRSEIAQNIVTGRVSDKHGEPLIGVSVRESGTTNGTTTRADGRFSIKVSNASPTLIFTYIGYTSQSVNMGTRSSINVILAEEMNMLDELVVVGYGTQKKKLTTGASVQVKGEDLQKLSTSSVMGALQSQSPGVQITQSSGMPGESFKVTIRGLGTVGNSSPLYVIDGVAGGDINTLNPSDIASVDN